MRPTHTGLTSKCAIAELNFDGLLFFPSQNWTSYVMKNKMVIFDRSSYILSDAAVPYKLVGFAAYLEEQFDYPISLQQEGSEGRVKYCVHHEHMLLVSVWG